MALVLVSDAVGTHAVVKDRTYRERERERERRGRREEREKERGAAGCGVHYSW